MFVSSSCVADPEPDPENLHWLIRSIHYWSEQDQKIRRLLVANQLLTLLGTDESSPSPFLLLPFLLAPSIIPLSFPPDSPPVGLAGPIAFSSLFGAAFLFPASNPPKMLSLSPSTNYKQTLTSCFWEPRRRHKGLFLPVQPLLAKNSFAFGFFFVAVYVLFPLQLHRFCCLSLPLSLSLSLWVRRDGRKLAVGKR